MFQHTAARRRLCDYFVKLNQNALVSTHSRPKAAVPASGCGKNGIGVSTHSRPKAAVPVDNPESDKGNSFNTQPPEGGCCAGLKTALMQKVSTHSRPKAAVPCILFCSKRQHRFQHTAARRRLYSSQTGYVQSG